MIVKILVACFLACSVAFAAPPPIQKCKLDDAKCMKATTQAFIPIFAAGNPEWGIERMEPFFMKHLDASSKQLTLVLKDITGTGLDKCEARKIQFDQAKSKLLVKLECTVNFDGHYNIDGNIIFLKIQGNGHAHVVLRKVVISVEADMAEVTGKDGLQHWSVKRYTHSYELKDKATIELENLFNGNEELGRVAKDLFAASPNEIVDEVGPPIIAAVTDKIVVNVNHMFKKVPMKYLVEHEE